MTKAEIKDRIAVLKLRLPVATHRDDATELARTLHEIAMLERKLNPVRETEVEHVEH